ncbi:hypothetical protein [Streptomyces viridochromogenes]|uniref:hypothetical protein n=1 Tax=Streptomyces viridochromogenes TaxID=1938 RepID=UPI0018FE08F4|nr:hypothetical protein [Streptomyces viridochromogenes]
MAEVSASIVAVPNSSRTAKPAGVRKEALGVLAGLGADHVVAGHKRPGRPDSPGILVETRAYIDDFEDRVARTASTEELYRAMLELHPDRVNPGALWGSARSVKG